MSTVRPHGLTPAPDSTALRRRQSTTRIPGGSPRLRTWLWRGRELVKLSFHSSDSWTACLRRETRRPMRAAVRPPVPTQLWFLATKWQPQAPPRVGRATQRASPRGVETGMISPASKGTRKPSQAEFPFWLLLRSAACYTRTDANCDKILLPSLRVRRKDSTAARPGMNCESGIARFPGIVLEQRVCVPSDN